MAQLVNFYLCNQPEKNHISAWWRWKSAECWKVKSKPCSGEIHFHKTAGSGLGCPTCWDAQPSHWAWNPAQLCVIIRSRMCLELPGAALLSVLSHPEMLSIHPFCSSQQFLLLSTIVVEYIICLQFLLPTLVHQVDFPTHWLWAGPCGGNDVCKF